MKPPEGRENTADIICIGAQRAMTTWLHGVVSADPRCWTFPDNSPLTGANKEARFWPRNRGRGLDWYRCLMTPPEARERLSLDFSPDYALLTESQVFELRLLSPTAKVIYVLRDPLARALSALRMHTMWDSDNAPAETRVMHLDYALRQRAERARLWQHCDYSLVIRRWQRHFPDMILLNMEDLANDPVQGSLSLMNRLGLDPYAIPETKRAEIIARAQRRIWVSPAYRAAPDLVHWLHGATWYTRQETEREAGITFTEFDGILKRAVPHSEKLPGTEEAASPDAPSAMDAEG